MKRLTLTAGAVLLTLGIAAAEAAPTRSAEANAGVANAEAVGADAEVAAYAAMLLSLQQIQAPLLGSVSAIGERFRPGGIRLAELQAILREIDSLRTLAAEVTRQLEALALPTIALLPIPPELQPEALRREQLSVIAELSSMLSHFDDGIRAIGQGNIPRTRRAEAAVYESAMTMLRQRILFMRAGQATLDRTLSEWDFAEAEIIMLRSTQQFMQVFNVSVPMNRAELTRELSALAEAMRQVSREAATKSVAERANLDASMEAGDLPPATMRMLARVRTASDVDDRYVAMLDEWADMLTDVARQVSDRRVTQYAAAAAIMPRFRALRQRATALETEIAAVFADR